MKMNPALDRLIGQPPKIGIRPAIDGRYQGVRESLEDITMTLAQNVAAFLSANLLDGKCLVLVLFFAV
ncbi:MAG: hypothetical protein ACK2UH_12035, partial [Candidatus Promineifilaceae bacterium]